MEAKKVLRKKILRKLRERDSKERAGKSKTIEEKLLLLKEVSESKNIMCYISLNTEVDTKGFIKTILTRGKKVFAPYIDGENMGISEIKDPDKDLESGRLGIPEPKKSGLRPRSPGVLDVAIVPGVAFDKAGNRLGRGKAYYDRFLSGPAKDVKKIGVCFDFQLLESVPHGSRDIPVDTVITN